jgi:protocatechuate 3,4-dioxygenase alpha subunit
LFFEAGIARQRWIEMGTPSPYCTIGPFFPTQFADECDNLTQFEGKTARGQHIVLKGRVVEDGNVPVGNAILEIWQADANGIFRHPLDPRCSEADPGFFGWGRARTDAQGRYCFRTVAPGSYGERRPHINMMVLAIGLTRRLVTTVFFTDSLGDIEDPVVSSVPEAARRRLLAVRDKSLDAAGVEGYRFDIVLRGENETPFFVD